MIMKTQIKVISKHILADTITPVSIYLKIRDSFPNSILLESSDYHVVENSYSYICLEPLFSFVVDQGIVTITDLDGATETKPVDSNVSVPDELNKFIGRFEIVQQDTAGQANGIFGYSTYDSVQYFEDIRLSATRQDRAAIPDMVYSVYHYIIAINHFKNTLCITENLVRDMESSLNYVESLLFNRNFASYPFHTAGEEVSNITDKDFMGMVTHGREHCHRGDVFQIVLSRQYSLPFTGDDFAVYRCLRSINPSPYLFYFDYGSYKIFGSSPEALLQIRDHKAFIYPIAGTFRRTGNDEQDKELALKLTRDSKENAEHVMLVDLARNDLSRNASQVTVDTFREVQFYSHVIHMVSKVSGVLPAGYNAVRVMADTFPAGTLSGAPKFKAMELIDKYENLRRGYYGGGIGLIGFNGDVNHAIMIRSFLSRDNMLFYQAGAGIVADSIEKNELNEVGNKLMALKRAINMANDL
jgi:anthranilate synthase component 1